jgi:hypothetical protein
MGTKTLNQGVYPFIIAPCLEIDPSPQKGLTKK